MQHRTPPGSSGTWGRADRSGRSGRGLRGRVLALAVVLPAALAALATPASATVGLPASATVGPSTEIAWSVAPADADGPDGRVSLRHVLEPGQRVDDAIAVTNSSARPATFRVVVGDGVVGPDGAFDVASEPPADAGSWVQVAGLDEGELTVGAGETRVLPVTIATPVDAAAGDHPAGIVVGLSQTGDGVRVTHRMGVRLHLQVAGELVPALAATVTDVRYRPSGNPLEPGSLRVDYVLENTGNVRLAASVRATAAGPWETGPQTVTLDSGELLPGDVVPRTVEVPAWPLLRLTGEVEVVPLAVGEDVVDLPDATAAAFAATAVPWLELLVLLAAVAAAVVVARRIRRPRRGDPGESGQADAR